MVVTVKAGHVGHFCQLFSPFLAKSQNLGFLKFPGWWD